MIVVGIDSAETSGIAVLDGPRLVRRGTVEIRGAADVERAVEAILVYRPDLVCVEDCYIRPNDHTGIMLARLTGRWLQEFERRGIRTALVLASTWQPIVLGCAHRAKREERKRLAVDFAAERFGVRAGEDVADAIGIAAWAARTFAGTPATPDAETPSHAQVGAA